MTQLRTAALSDVGHLRSQNEDRYLRDDRLSLYGVADGIGGLPGGEDAAQMAVEEIAKAVQKLERDPAEALVGIVQETSECIADLGARLSPRTGIGTTLTVSLFREGSVYIAHVGDSRCYVWKDGQIDLLTRDHSVESDARLKRARGEVAHYHEAHRHALTRCMGQPTPVEVEIHVRPLMAGERYLVCTDGVTRLIRQSELGEIIGAASNPEEAARYLVELANRRGGPDNATAVVVFVDEP
jgi:serine/threonine protein phosphatase PrpC